MLYLQCRGDSLHHKLMEGKCYTLLTSALLNAPVVLMATSSPRDFQYPLYTVPVPPSPTFLSNSRSEISISCAVAAKIRQVTNDKQNLQVLQPSKRQETELQTT